MDKQVQSEAEGPPGSRTVALNVAHALWIQARTNPTRPALQDGPRDWTFAELYGDARHYSDSIADLGVGRGDRVLLVASTSASFVIAYYALLSIGAVAVTVNPASTAPELQHFALDADCALILASHESGKAAVEVAENLSIPLHFVEPASQPSRSDARSPVDVGPHDLAVLLYTSGTTGRPKGAELTHANLIASATGFRAALNITDQDRVGTGLPLFHVFGQVVVMGTTFSAGARLTIQAPFSASGLLRTAAEQSLTVVAGVPTMWNAMLHSQVNVLASELNLRLAISGGAALPLAVCREFDDRFNCTILGGYGLTETAGAATFNQPLGLTKEGSVGDALPGVLIALHDDEGRDVPTGHVGEVALQGPMVMRGYWRQPAETSGTFRDGWLLTGDLGRFDEDGYLWIVDRKKDLIIRGGYNVYPKEIEELLYQHPSVLEAAVIGLPDDHLGEEICAVITTTDGEKLDPVSLSTWLAERLSPYKLPRVYRVVPALPKGSTGKILKREILPLSRTNDDVMIATL